MDELPGALAVLRDQLQVRDGPLALVAGSMGAWVAQSVVADTDLPVSTAALVSPAIRLRSVVARYERMWEFESGAVPTLIGTGGGGRDPRDGEHSLAEEPGIEPAPQTSRAERVDRVLTQWFRRHLTD